MSRVEVVLQTELIDVNHYYQKIVNPRHGGNTIFIGTVRQVTGDVMTTAIDYYAYEQLAKQECQLLGEEVAKKYSADVVIVHRLGTLNISDIAVFIGVSTPHRQASFEGSHYIIEQLKKRVPIWKKEYDGDQVRWGGIRDDSNR